MFKTGYFRPVSNTLSGLELAKKKKVMVYECLVIMLLCDKFLTSKKETLNVLQF